MRVEDAYTQMGIDESIAYARRMGETPNTVRLYRWNPSAVSVGYFQSMRDEVDLESCRRLGVDVIRRITGGGAVFHDYDGEITYSLIAPDDDPKIPKDIVSSYRLICGCLIRGLRALGLEAEFKPINDIVAGGRKISGNAQTRRIGVVHQHGTILREVDPALMFSLLKVPSEKIRDKLIKSVEERVTSINNHLGREVSFEEMKKAFKEGFEKAFKIKLVERRITEYENGLTVELREKYASKEWNFKR